MQKLRLVLHRLRWYFLSTILVALALILLFGYWMKGFGDALAAKAYAEYVTAFYLPEQRRRLHRWPTNLDGVSQLNASEHDGMAEEIILTHHREFQSFEPLESTPQSYTYVIHLRTYDVTCTARLFPKDNDGRCDYRKK